MREHREDDVVPFAVIAAAGCVFEGSHLVGSSTEQIVALLGRPNTVPPTAGGATWIYAVDSDGVLTLPMLGVLDSARTAEVMDNLLDRVASSGARFAILDLTGVEMVDTKVASHLIGLVTAIGLLGAQGIVAGLKPNVAQTMVALGLDMSQIVTQRNLRAALSYCIRKTSQSLEDVGELVCANPGALVPDGDSRRMRGRPEHQRHRPVGRTVFERL